MKSFHQILLQELHPSLSLPPDYLKNVIPPGPKPLLVNVSMELLHVVSVTELDQVNLSGGAKLQNLPQTKQIYV